MPHWSYLARQLYRTLEALHTAPDAESTDRLTKHRRVHRAHSAVGGPPPVPRLTNLPGVDDTRTSHLAGGALDRCRGRVQLRIHGHRGAKDDRSYKSRRVLQTGAGLLADKQVDRLRATISA